ncbi:MAG: HD domain-containing protein [Helicobacteraceae bacterium]|jgi:putative hydrolase of HD superfamily|nr:HD domain-containing protein [Helicobacteraceae bacterium]
MISCDLILFFYNAASISRWNDYPRFVDLNELDKQSHKFAIAFFLATYEDDIDHQKLIETGIFEFLRRVIVTDIRPDVFREVLAEKQNEINEWMLNKIAIYLKDQEFLRKMTRYFSDENFYKKERKLLAAAHYLATRWEFNIVYQSSMFLSDINNVKKSIEEEIANFSDFKGVVEIGLNGKLAKIIDLCGRLRFQIRWSQTPRLPKTSVLGHQLIVALFSYFYSIKINACKTRLANNFYCALFHDLPEVMTRDIISPVKYGVGGLDHLLASYEIKLINDEILPLVPDKTKSWFSYILGLLNNGKNEFANRVFEEYFVRVVDDPQKYNEDRFNTIDGAALKACDHLGAFTEASLSISYGIRSKELENGLSLLNQYKEIGAIGGVNFADLMRDFQNMLRNEKVW